MYHRYTIGKLWKIFIHNEMQIGKPSWSNSKIQRRTGMKHCKYKYFIYKIIWIGIWTFIRNKKYKLNQKCKSAGHQFTVATKFFKMGPNICVSSVQNLTDSILLASRNLRWLLYFWRIFATLTPTVTPCTQSGREWVETWSHPSRPKKCTRASK